MVILVFAPGIRFGQAIGQLARGLLLETPQRLSLLAAASALNLSLAGPGSMYGGPDWIGTGVARVMYTDIRKGMYLFSFLCLVLFSLMGLFI